MTAVAESAWSLQPGFPVLRPLIATPVLAMAAALMARSARQSSAVGWVGAGIEFALAVFVVVRFDASQPAFQLVEHVRFFPPFVYHLGMDGLNPLFIPLTALLTFLVLLYEAIVHERPPRLHIASVFGWEATPMGMFLSLDLLQFWFFTGMELLPALFILRRWSTGHDLFHAARFYRAS